MVRYTIKLKNVKFLGGLRTSYSVNFFSASLGQIKLFCKHLTKMHELFVLQTSTCCSYIPVRKERCRKHAKLPTKQANICLYLHF